MGKTKDLTGMKFGRWKVISYAGLYHEGKPTHGTSWKCICECGTIREKVRSHFLIHGKSRSCGCLHKEMLSKRVRTHGLTKTHKEMYQIWQGIKTRCYNTAHHSFKQYGATGIKMHPPWQESFTQFLADVGPRPSKLFSIDRYPDPFGDYEPTNVRWATDSEQAHNTRRTHKHEWKGHLTTLTSICRMEDVRYANTYQRVYAGIPLPEAINQVRALGYTFLERAAFLGGSPKARITTQKRNRGKKSPTSV